MARRTGGQPLNLFTSDENPAYAVALVEVSGVPAQPRRKGRRGRQPLPGKVPPADLVYATVAKTRKHNRVVKVKARRASGTPAALAEALANSAVRERVTTVDVERLHGTDRNRNARTVRTTSCFSKAWAVPEATTYFTAYSSTFCWPVRTLREGDRHHGYRQRAPAMAAGLTDHSWTLQEWLTLPAVQRV